MVDISIENYQNAIVYTITVCNREQFWVRMKEVQKGLGIKNISDLIKKEIHGTEKIFLVPKILQRSRIGI